MYNQWENAYHDYFTGYGGGIYLAHLGEGEDDFRDIGKGHT